MAIKFAVELGADIDHQDDDGRTPLHHAIDANLSASAKELISFGASKSIENEAGYTAEKFCQFVLKNDVNHESCRLVIDDR